MPFTDKTVKNDLLSVRFQPFRTRFYGQMVQKSDFVRKMGFAYGQIIKNEGFVRKFERDLGLITDKQFQNSTLSVIPSRRTD